MLFKCSLFLVFTLVILNSSCGIQGNQSTLDSGFRPGLPSPTNGATTTPALNPEFDVSWTPQWATLVSYWKMNGDWNDAVGASNGIPANGPVFFAPAQVGTFSGSFDGVDDYVGIAGGGGLDGLPQGTIVFWVKWTGLQTASCCGGFGPAMSRQRDGVFSNNIFELDNTDPNSAHIVWKADSAFAATVTSTSLVGSGVWRHIAITFGAGTHSLYIDGVLDNSAASGAVLVADPTIALVLGGWLEVGNPSNGNAAAMMDDVAVWTTPLLASEILTIYNRQK